jgi:Ca2+/H+ antiporter, TMEM165/GDT1 family
VEVILIAMAVVAIAELGDKTQLVAVVMASRLRRPLAIAAGMTVALATMHSLAAFGGAFIDALLPDRLLGWMVGIGFCLMAIWTARSDGHERAEIPRPTRQRQVFLTALVVFVMLEFGDKSQLTTVGLSIAMTPTWQVGLGAALGSILVNLPMIWLGYRLQNRLPQRLLHRLATLMFLLVGLAILIHQLLTMARP